VNNSNNRGASFQTNKLHQHLHQGPSSLQGHHFYSATSQTTLASRPSNPLSFFFLPLTCGASSANLLNDKKNEKYLRSLGYNSFS